MKNRALAVTLTIVIFAVIAVCFLRPGDDGHNAALSEPAAVKLVGENADKFKLTYIGEADSSTELPPSLIFEIEPLDGKSYTLGYMSWLPRHRDSNGGLGRVERMDNDGWQPYSTLESLLGWYGMFSPEDVERVLMRPGLPLQFACALPVQEAGHYRATVVLREYDTEQKRSGDEIYEVSFEYDIPKR